MIEVKRQHDLIEEKWTFYFDDRDLTLYLDTYVYGVKPNTRSKPRTQKYYSRLSSRDSNTKEPEVPLPDDVQAEAIASIVSKVNVKRWSQK